MEEVVNKSIQVIGFTRNADFQLPVFNANKELLQENIILLRVGCQHEEFLNVLQEVQAEDIMLVDLDRVALPVLNALGQAYGKTERKDHVYYVSNRKRKLWLGFVDAVLWRGDRSITDSPVLIGNKSLFMKAYAGDDLDGNLLRAVSYSLQKAFREIRDLGGACYLERFGKRFEPCRELFWEDTFSFFDHRPFLYHLV